MSITYFCTVKTHNFIFEWQGSKFYENELKKEQQVNQRIEKMTEQKARITKEQLKQAQAEVLCNNSVMIINVITGFSTMWTHTSPVSVLLL